MRPLPRLLVALTAAGCAVLGPALAAQAAGTGSITTAPSAEGWYRTAPICVLPTGCPEAPSPYAPDTLHVGVNAGQEEARTTLLLDLTALPAGTQPAGGQLRLPLATDLRDGTRNAATAKLRACLVVEPVEDADGSFAPAPKADCDAASVDAVFVPAQAEAPAAFTVDLAVLATAWQDAAVPGALALVPGEVAPSDSWHVALSDRSRQGEGVAKVTAAVSFVSASVDTEQLPPEPVFAPVDPGSPALVPSDVAFFAAEPLPEAPSVALDAPAPAPAPAAAAPQAAPPTAVVPVASFVDAGFRYPAVFLLPLLVAVAVTWCGRALTRDLATS